MRPAQGGMLSDTETLQEAWPLHSIPGTASALSLKERDDAISGSPHHDYVCASKLLALVLN